ncbi:MAG: DUF4242 domain-containing protein [Vicinamibacterales bacterium]
MPKFVIERDIAGAGRLSPQELQAISQTSCRVLTAMGPRIQWMQSFVTDDAIYCVYRRARRGGRAGARPARRLPANRVSQVRAVIDPTTAE